MSDVIERFRYRFRLWRRGRREGSFWRPSTGPEALARWEDPKYRRLVTESTPRFLVRVFAVYFGILIIAAQICRFVAGLVPSIRSDLLVIFIVFSCLWTLFDIFSTIDLCIARKAHRKGASKSSNQSLEPTAGRRDDHI
jgi:hypothetical protein